MKDFFIGCNYWSSRSGTDMWRDWSAETVENDFKVLAQYGVKHLRVFPNWRDFQPITALYGIRGTVKELRFADGSAVDNEYGLDETAMAHFEEMCRLAGKYNIQLIVAIITGWMSGRLFVPPFLEGKNIISDPEALVWQSKFATGFVKRLKHRPEIVAWDLGNECNNLGATKSSGEARLWTLTIRNAILAADSSRMIMSGMHALAIDEGEKPWLIQHQGEICDMLTPHPYPSPTVGGDIDPMNKPRTTLVSTAQLVFYSSIGGKPAMIQEQGTFADMLGNREMAARFVQVNLFSSMANGGRGLLWWCAHEHKHLSQPPYGWIMVERELGLVDENFRPKPVAYVIKQFSELLDKLPFDHLPAARCDAAIISPKDMGTFPFGQLCSAYILAKQAGLNAVFRNHDQALPEVPLYIVPGIRGWNVMNKDQYELLLHKAAEGASVCFSVDTGLLTDFESSFGVVSEGMETGVGRHSMCFEGREYSFSYAKKFHLRPQNATVLARDESGNPVFVENSYGKGKLYLIAFPFERMLWNTPGSFAEGKDNYRIYEKLGRSVLEKKPIISNNPMIGLTIHDVDQTRAIVIAVNYSDKPQENRFELRGAEIGQVYHGDVAETPACSGTIFELNIGSH